MSLPAFAGPGFGWSCCDVVVVVVVGGGGGGRVVLADVFWLSVKGSSMLSIVQECREGLLSRHRAWRERGRGEGEGGMIIKLIMRMQCFILNFVFFPDLDTVTAPSPPPTLSICLTKVSRKCACLALYKPDELFCACVSQGNCILSIEVWE